MTEFHRIGRDITPELNRSLESCAGRILEWAPSETGFWVVFEAGRPRGGFRASGTDDLAVFSVRSAANEIVPTGETIRVEFSFPTEGVLRIVVGAPGVVRFVRDTGTTPPFTIAAEDGTIRLESLGYRLSIDEGNPLFEMTGPDSGLIARQAIVKSIYWGYQSPPLGRLCREERASTVLSLERHAGESFYGFGEQFTDLDKRNQVIDIRNIDPANTLSAGSYVGIPFYLSTGGYGLLLDSSKRSRFDMGSRTTASVGVEIDGSDMDLYLLAGTMKEALAKYFDLTGRPVLTPPWSFGLWMSSLPAYTSAEGVLAAADDFRARGFPCDLLHVDPVWMGQKSLVCDFHPGPGFPEMEGFRHELGERGFKLSLWVAPYVPVGSPLHDEGLAKGFFVKDPSGRVLVNEGAMNFWSVPFSYVDFTNPDAKEWYKACIRLLASQGVDVIKNDLGELGPDEALYHDGTEGPEGHNRYCQLYATATFEACRDVFGEDAMIWSRSGFIGAATTPCHWAGDVQADFEHMRGQLRAVLGAGMGGFVFFSHDTGGFTGKPTPELYARWFQMGCFTSHMRAHGCFPHEPWHYGDRVYRICLDYARLRYALLPTLYSAAARCCEEGRPLAAALVLENQEDPAVRGIDDEYLFADSLLVCPVFGGDTRRTVYLPYGGWFDFHTGAYLEGGVRIPIDCPLETMPLFVKEDAVLVTCAPREAMPKGEAEWGPLQARVYTRHASGTFSRRIHTSRNHFRDIIVEVDNGTCFCADSDVTPLLAAGKGFKP